VPRRLGRDDWLYRAIDPDHRDQNGPQQVAFEDPGKSYDSISLWVASVVVQPVKALEAIARFSRARAVCKTGRRLATAQEMYANGYRAVRLPAMTILQAIEATRETEWPMRIDQDEGHDYSENGHLNLFKGKYYSQRLADKAYGLVELSE